MPYATKLFHNAVILTMDERDTVASAIALDGERILAVGSRADVEPFVGPERNAAIWAEKPSCRAFMTRTGTSC